MKFSMAEKQQASKYGLRLGSPYETVKRFLIQNGWFLDQKWMEENALSEPTKKDLICGSGWDAVCSTAYRKNGKTISLLFSGTNDGIPLVGVETEP